MLRRAQTNPTFHPTLEKSVLEKSVLDKMLDLFAHTRKLMLDKNYVGRCWMRL